MPNLIPAPILSSVYRFPRCCLMPSGYGENSRGEMARSGCVTWAAAFTPFDIERTLDYMSV